MEIAVTRNLRLRPRAGESLPSFGSLVAHALSPNWNEEAASLFGEDYSAASSLSDPKAAAAIAEVVGLSVADLLPCRVVRSSGSQTVTVGPFVVAGEHVTGSVRRLSPKTLAADAKQGVDPYHRVVWTITPLQIDPINRDRLIEKCPDCGSKFTWWLMAHPARCDRCGKKIWLCIDSEAPYEASERDIVIADLFHPDEKVRRRVLRRFPPNERSATEGEVLDFLVAVEALVRLSSRRSPYAELDLMAIVEGGERALKRQIQKIVDETILDHGKLGLGIGVSKVLQVAYLSLFPRTTARVVSWLSGLH